MRCSSCITDLKIPRITLQPECESIPGPKAVVSCLVRSGTHRLVPARNRMQVVLECPRHLADFGKVLFLQTSFIVSLVGRRMREPIFGKSYCSLKC